jgi:hypothetical protein
MFTNLLHDRRFWLGVSFGGLVGLSVANLFELIFIIPYFKNVFLTYSPGKPLPPVTLFFINYRFILTLVIAAWISICGICSVYEKRYAVALATLGTIWLFLQIGAIAMAMIMPMVQLDTWMPDVTR